MANTFAGGIQVVEVSMTDSVIGGTPTKQLWVAALPRSQAVAAVMAAIPEGWTAKLSLQHLTVEHAARLKLRVGEVRELTS
jgi:hypothetical protein